LRGESGAGKTTVLNMIAGLRRPEAGDVLWGDWPVYTADDSRRPATQVDRVRPDMLGFVFQDKRLASVLSGLQNIELPARLAGRKPDVAWIRQLTGVFFPRLTPDEIEQKLRSGKVSSFSGGQQERVAAIRAFSLRPPFVLADEILDSVAPTERAEIWQQVKALCKANDIGLILVTHGEIFLSDPEVDKALEIRDGSIHELA
jgi:putative ABC transport system ATP-binding protein